MELKYLADGRRGKPKSPWRLPFLVRPQKWTALLAAEFKRDFYEETRKAGERKINEIHPLPAFLVSS
jgi:hypothetical protein